MIKRILFLVCLLFIPMLLTTRVQAQGDCQVVYGGGATLCPSPTQARAQGTTSKGGIVEDSPTLAPRITQLSPALSRFAIYKSVKRPNGQFVKNLTVNDEKYQAGSTVTFQVVVQNTGTRRISRLNVVDIFPQFLTYASGNGRYDPASRSLTFSVDNLDSGRSLTFVITAKAAAAASLPAQAVTCMVNQVRATDTASNSSQVDASQVCIEKTVTATGATPPSVLATPPVTKTPPTGPEEFVLPLLGASGALGFFLRRKSI